MFLIGHKTLRTLWTHDSATNDSATDDMRVDMVNVVVETLNGSAAAWLTRGRRSRSGYSKRFIATLSIKLMRTIAGGLYLNLNI